MCALDDEANLPHHCSHKMRSNVHHCINAVNIKFKTIILKIGFVLGDVNISNLSLSLKSELVQNPAS